MNVLVAEDDRMSREMLRRIIESDASHRVTVAEDGEQAWKELCDTSKQFDVAIIDINMPRIDGFRLIERMRATPSLKSMQAILCTAAADRNTVSRASALSVSHYIIKPYSKAVILGKLQTVQGEIARQGFDDRSMVLKRLQTDEATYRVLANALLGEVGKWTQLCRYTADMGKFFKLAERVPGLRGASASLGLASLATRLEEVELTIASDSAASKGQHSPLLFEQITPVFEQLDLEVRRLQQQLGEVL